MPFPLDNKYLEIAEEKVGAKLPDSYRQAMMAANGGEVVSDLDDWYLYPIMDNTDREALCTNK